MISIIICSRLPKINSILSQNIEKTVGCDYELIIIDNSENSYSIFEAYNIGIKQSKGDYWCFLHDDVLFHSEKWGIAVNDIFKSDEKIGLLGIAGAKIKTKMPSAWWDCPEDHKVIHIIQHLGTNEKTHWELGWKNLDIEEVAVIDGVFMVGRRDALIQFDTRLVGFHNYDLNLSLMYHRNKYKVVVTKAILLEHFSLGTIDLSWYKSTLQFDTLYSKFLSLQIGNTLNKAQLKVQELKNGMMFCKGLVRNNLKSSAMRFWLRLFVLKPVSKFHFHFVNSLIRKC